MSTIKSKPEIVNHWDPPAAEINFVWLAQFIIMIFLDFVLSKYKIIKDTFYCFLHKRRYFIFVGLTFEPYSEDVNCINAKLRNINIYGCRVLDRNSPSTWWLRVELCKEIREVYDVKYIYVRCPFRPGPIKCTKSSLDWLDSCFLYSIFVHMSMIRLNASLPPYPSNNFSLRPPPPPFA